MDSQEALFIIYGTYFFTALIFSVLINALFLKFSKTLGIRSTTERRWSPTEKPALGGISFYILFLLSIVAYSLFIDQKKLILNTHYLGLIIAVNLGFLMGLSDDAYNTKPFLKLFVQLSCAVMLIVSGIYIQLFGNDWLNYFFTVLWVIGLMNSINMLDNMDGITASVSSSIIITTISYILLNDDFTNIHLMLLLGVLAGLLGFLYFNWHPSKMFMGDTGSQFLGVFLAAIGIIYFWNGNNYYMNDLPVSRKIIVPLLVFVLPLIDTSIVVIKRINKGRSPFIGGKDHTTHALAYWGLSDSMVAVVFAFISSISLLFIIAIEKWLTWNVAWAISFSCYILTVFSVLFYFSTKKHKKA